MSTTRIVIPIRFSREFEGLLLTHPFEHITLTEDIETLVFQGLKLLEELEDVHDLEHVEIIAQLIRRANDYVKMDSPHFKHWHLSISPDLLDEIDLLLLAHGDDLKQLGLTDTTHGGILVLLVTSNFVLDAPLKPSTGSVASFSKTFKQSLDLKRTTPLS